MEVLHHYSHFVICVSLAFLLLLFFFKLYFWCMCGLQEKVGVTEMWDFPLKETEEIWNKNV